MKGLKIISSWIFFMAAMMVFFLDIGGVFAYNDPAFFLFFLCYGFFTFLNKPGSTFSFILSFWFLFLMSLSFIPTSVGRTTERFGEWFFLMFLFSLLYRIKELWRH